MLNGKSITVLALIAFLVFVTPGFAKTDIVSTMVHGGVFLARWPAESTPAAAWARLEAQQRAFGGLSASLDAITVPASETVPATIRDLTPWAVPGGAPPAPET